MSGDGFIMKCTCGGLMVKKDLDKDVSCHCGTIWPAQDEEKPIEDGKSSTGFLQTV